LEVRHGEIFAFLGPNGAGKTTTVEILEGFRRATDGSIDVLGHDPWRAPASWRARIGDRQLEATQIVFSPPGRSTATDLPAVVAQRVERHASGRLLLPSTRVAADLYALAGWALERGLEFDDLEVTRPTLEDVYLQLTAETDAPERSRP
jgi:ABC-type glutathione transport system ATPase component